VRVRIDPLLVLALGFVGGGYLSTAFWPALLVSACIFVALVLAKVIPVPWLMASAAVFGLSGYRAAAFVAESERERIEVRDWIESPKRCAAQGRVVTSSVVREGVPRFAAELWSLDCEAVILEHPVRAQLTGGPLDLARGDRFFAVMQLAPVQAFFNSELPDPRPRLARRATTLSGGVLSLERELPGAGLLHAIDVARAHSRSRIEATFSPPVVPMAKALVLGDNDLSVEDSEAFRKGGLMHLLAVSGTHLVFAVLGLLKVLRFVLVRIEVLAVRTDVGRGVALLGAFLAPLYADFAGGSGSAWRAAWMLSAGLLARASARKPMASRSITASLFAGGVFDPLVAYDISFLLSLAATVGLLTLGQWLSRLTKGRDVRAIVFLQTASIATLSSMVPCVPLLVLLSPTLSLASVGANVIAGPLGEAVALPLCLGHSLLTPFPALELGVARVASGALLCIQHIAHAAAGVQWLAFEFPAPTTWQLGVLMAGVGMTLGCLGRRFGDSGTTNVERSLPFFRRIAFGVGLATLATVISLEVAQSSASRPFGSLRVTALDVGQGDATLVDLPEGQLMLIDGGGMVGTAIDPGQLVIEPMLRMRRRRHIDVMVLSHPHPDHFLGLLKVARDYSVGEFWDTGQGEAFGAGPVYAELLAVLRSKRVPIKRPDELCGERRIGGATIDVLSPCPKFDSALGANDNSLVLRIRHGERAVLLVGDAEHEAEQRLLVSAPQRLHADLLKVGHHGSRSSTTPAFLRAVAPTWASISCGVRNRFGHPHASTLATLSTAGVHTLRLDRLGSIIWQSDGRDQQISVFSTGH
jgi:competence protein ComEC